MLVITRKVREKILIGNDIVIVVERIGNDRVRLAIDAPKDVEVDREEIRKRKERGRE